jgi:pimeloyl-ACP methyl ester carboxylesterase
MPVARLSSTELHYTQLGNPNAPPLVLLHGAMENFEACWKRVAPHLESRYHIIGVDMRGHGRSTNAADQLDLRQMADDVADLLDLLRIESAHVCGFSGGASVALFFGYRHLARAHSLTLISNNYTLDQTRGASNFWDAERMKNEEPLWWKFLHTTHVIDPRVLLNWWRVEDRIRPNFTHEQLAQITCPVLVMGGDRDPIVPLSQTISLYQHLPNAQLCVMPGIGHGVHRHRTVVFIESLIHFHKSLINAS